MIFWFMVGVIVVALAFDFFNGFHDAANAISTIVVTKTLTPAQAVVLAGLANFVGYFTFGTAVASTVGKGVIDIKVFPHEALLPILAAALVGAILWNIITWLLGLPTSSSHALIGGLAGAAIAAAGVGAVNVAGITTIVEFLVLAPVLGFLASLVLTNIVLFFARGAKPKPAAKTFKILQLFSASVYAFSHGTNDAQKTMGVIALALVAGGVSADFSLSGSNEWIVLSCYTAMAVGTMLGGWRIVKTMGTRITKIRAMEGFCAETASSTVMLLTAHFGIPVSTTHVIAGSIMGVGTVERAAGVRWVTARKIVWAWLLTIPFTGAIGALVFFLIRLLMSV
ncbi:MAG TPA: inorganic phosphate transporter [Rectinemataceae bacterium]|nr:inorganic phosphate transporter [Rectinemataceae bacterium]